MKKNTINILFIGDIVGRPGRRAVCELLPHIKKEYDIDVTFANGENLASGSGITYEKYQEMLSAGIDYFTSGNHVWNKTEFLPYLGREDIKIIRPANYTSDKPGRGIAQIEIKGEKIVLANLIGRVFMKEDESVTDPFQSGKEIADKFSDSIIFIDFHAEATSEKSALGNYLDGHVAAVVGTHTHVQTADERILPSGTAFISDVGMCGPIDSVIGVKKEIIIEKFLTGLPKSHKVASGDSIFNAVVVEVNTETKKTVTIKRV